MLSGENSQSTIRNPYSEHPSQERFGVEEATVTELVEFFENEKKCSVNPSGKPCDHCAMCSSADSSGSHASGVHRHPAGRPSKMLATRRQMRAHLTSPRNHAVQQIEQRHSSEHYD